jgi:hypothetical protein
MRALKTGHGWAAMVLWAATSAVMVSAAAAEPTAIDSPWPAFQFGATGVAPMRPLLSWLHAATSFTDADQTLHVVLHGGAERIAMHLTVGSPTALVNGAKLSLDPAPFEAHGAFYVPVRPVLEALGVKLTWQAAPRGLVLAFGDQQAFLPILAPFYALVGDREMLVGGRIANQWAPADVMSARLVGGERYWLYGLGGAADGVAEGGKPAKQTPGDWLRVALRRPAGAATGLLAFGGPWNAQPRLARPVTPIPAEYQQIVSEQLAAKGLTAAAIHIQQALKVDLGNTGTEDVLLTAGSMDAAKPPKQAKDGDYSLVLLLRKSDGGVAKTIVLAGHVYTTKGGLGTPYTDEIAGVLDLTGDGTMQVITRYRYFDGGGIEVFAVGKEGAERVLSGGAGA